MKKTSVLKSVLLIIVFFAAALLLLYISASVLEKEDKSAYEMSSNAMRVEFLNSCGLIVKPTPDVQDIKIPQHFGTIYEEYNKLQLSQGLDLKKYAGRDAVLCRYTVLNCPEYPDNVTANLVICDDILIACDLTLNEENGFTKALIQ